MKLFFESSTSKYPNKINWIKDSTWGSAPLYWDTERGEDIVELLNIFSKILERDARIDSWLITADGQTVSIKFIDKDGEDHPYWTFKYNSLKSDINKNLEWLKRGLNRLL